jgi:hypothetical protein
MNYDVGLWFRMVMVNELVIDMFSDRMVFSFKVVCCGAAVLKALL